MPLSTAFNIKWKQAGYIFKPQSLGHCKTVRLAVVSLTDEPTEVYSGGRTVNVNLPTSQTEAELRETREDRDKIQKEKDEEVKTLNHRITQMERSYEGVLHDALDSLLEKIDVAMGTWETKSNFIQSKNKQVLLEFGLNPLDI